MRRRELTLASAPRQRGRSPPRAAAGAAGDRVCQRHLYVSPNQITLDLKSFGESAFGCVRYLMQINKYQRHRAYKNFGRRRRRVVCHRQQQMKRLNKSREQTQRRRRMSLVFTLASRNLFQDRRRFVASLIGIVLSIVLVMVQVGLYFGFGRMVTMVIDHAATDLWIIAKGAKCFEDLSILNMAMRKRLLAINGVAEAAPIVAGYSAWILPDGTIIPVFIIGSDVSAGGLAPWDIVDGNAQSLTAPETVAIDRTSYNRLGVSKIDDPAGDSRPLVTVGVITDGIRSFTTTPYRLHRS